MKNAAILLTLALAFACTTVPGGSSVDLRTLTNGTMAAVSPAEQQIEYASDDATYRRLWTSLVGTGEPPEIDFNKESVVFLLSGQRSTGGYSVQPRRARIEGRTLVVDATVNNPAADMVTTQALTSPYAVVAVQRPRPFNDVRWGR
jgi:hypothetical protein